MNQPTKKFTREFFKRFFSGVIMGLGIIAVLAAGLLVVKALSGTIPPGELNPDCAPDDPGCDIDWFNVRVSEANDAVNAEEAVNADTVDEVEAEELFRIEDCEICMRAGYLKGRGWDEDWRWVDAVCTPLTPTLGEDINWSGTKERYSGDGQSGGENLGIKYKIGIRCAPHS